MDEQFELFLGEIFGEGFMREFQEQHPAAFVDLLTAFESRKRSSGPHRRTPLNVALPFSFINLYRKMHKALTIHCEPLYLLLNTVDY